MPLPTENEVWPPKEWAAAFDQFVSNDVWLQGSEIGLSRFYAGAGNGTANRGDDPNSHYHNTPGEGAGIGKRVWRAITRPFWARASEVSSANGVPPQDRSRLHSPLAGNLATLSSDLLFAEPPFVRLVKGGDPMKGAEQERLDEIANSDATHMLLSQAGEWAAGLSGVVLTAHWDTDTTVRPWLQATPCDAAIPEYEGSRTVAVNLWTTYNTVNLSNITTAVYYHVERHELGSIVHAIYLGNASKIGVRLPVEQWADLVPELGHLASIRGADMSNPFAVRLPTGIDRLTAQYWRNLPTRQHRKDPRLSRLGRADFEGVETILSEIDAVWSSWMRDIKIARARLIVPNAYLEGGMMGPSFDDDAEILTGLEYAEGGASSSGETISAQQFEIRYQEHAQTILALVKEVLQHCGYSLSSYGEYGETAAKTATEVVDRTTATERTRDKKALYFKQAAAPIVEALLALDRVHYNQKGLPDGAEVEVEFPEISQQDPEKLARTLGLLRAAEAASTKTLVAMQHEDWDETEREQEVQRILAENNRTDTAVEEEDPTVVGRVDPITGLPAAPTDPAATVDPFAPDPTDPTNGERVPA